MFVRVFPAPTQNPFMWPFTGLPVASVQRDSKLSVLLPPPFRRCRYPLRNCPRYRRLAPSQQKVLGHRFPSAAHTLLLSRGEHTRVSLPCPKLPVSFSGCRSSTQLFSPANLKSPVLVAPVQLQQKLERSSGTGLP